MALLFGFGPLASPHWSIFYFILFYLAWGKDENRSKGKKTLPQESCGYGDNRSKGKRQGVALLCTLGLVPLVGFFSPFLSFFLVCWFFALFLPVNLFQYLLAR